MGEIVTPWPCFVIAAREGVISEHPEALKKLVLAIQECCNEFVNSPSTLESISKNCKLSIEDSKKWFETVKFSDGTISQHILKTCLDTLHSTGVLKGELTCAVSSLYSDKFSKVTQ